MPHFAKEVGSFFQPPLSAKKPSMAARTFFSMILSSRFLAHSAVVKPLQDS